MTWQTNNNAPSRRVPAALWETRAARRSWPGSLPGGRAIGRSGYRPEILHPSGGPERRASFAVLAVLRRRLAADVGASPPHAAAGADGIAPFRRRFDSGRPRQAICPALGDGQEAFLSLKQHPRRGDFAKVVVVQPRGHFARRVNGAFFQKNSRFSPNHTQGGQRQGRSDFDSPQTNTAGTTEHARPGAERSGHAANRTDWIFCGQSAV